MTPISDRFHGETSRNLKIFENILRTRPDLLLGIWYASLGKTRSPSYKYKLSTSNYFVTKPKVKGPARCLSVIVCYSKKSRSIYEISNRKMKTIRQKMPQKRTISCTIILVFSILFQCYCFCLQNFL